MKQSLLIVDDEPSNLQKLQRTFLEDFRIFQADSGDRALDLLKIESVDVIITDQRMPGMSGVDLLSRSLRWCPQALRVILTGYTDVDYLMDAINQGNVHRYITKPWEPFALRQTVLKDLEHARLKRQNQFLEEQLRIAKEVQNQLLPRRIPRLPGLDIAGVCRPAGQVGGDYYDFLQLNPHQLWFAVGDISGKGISAALLMASLQASLRSQVPRQRATLGALLAEINSLLGALTEDNKFATLFCGVIDDKRRQLTYANAGHNPAFLLSAGLSASTANGPNHPHRLEATGPPLGLFSGSRYEEVTVGTTTGDTLVVYTDGIIEARNSRGEDFGEHGVLGPSGDATLSSQELQQEVIRGVLEHRGDRPLTDDLTLVVIKWQ